MGLEFLTGPAAVIAAAVAFVVYIATVALRERRGADAHVATFARSHPLITLSLIAIGLCCFVVLLLRLGTLS